MAETLVHDALRAFADALVAHGPPGPGGARTFAPADYSVHFFLALAVILLASRLVGWIARRWFGQPQVVGEMIAGVLLGPSLFGMVAPQVQALVFPNELRPLLYAAAQLGVGLYMFLVGNALDPAHFRERARSAVGVSAAGIGVPVIVAIVLAPWLVVTPGLFAAGISRFNATLFLSACIALTAFPMLARIIAERGLAGTRLGALALTAGAFDDAVSWCLLAVVLATFGAGAGVALLAIGGGIAYAAFILLFGPRLFAPLGRAIGADGTMGGGVLGLTLAAFCLSAFLMDAIGIHAIFGGFILGVVMPRGRFSAALQRQVEPIATVLLLPIFFTYSGLNTRMDLMTSPGLLAIALVVLAGSVLAKFGACWLAARIAGEDNRTALGIGALMNARGLMELIIVNIGLQKGIIGPGLFAMLVLMAVVTTVMASPLFERVYGRHARRRAAEAATAQPAATG